MRECAVENIVAGGLREGLILAQQASAHYAGKWETKALGVALDGSLASETIGVSDNKVGQNRAALAIMKR